MVITKPMPSMPVKFWGDDEEMTRYKATYFDEWPGVWRQGDFFKVTARGGTFVLGRSDATLNRFGVRIGTAEIYNVLEGIPEVDDAIVVNLDLPGGQFFMPMFVKLADGHDAGRRHHRRDQGAAAARVHAAARARQVHPGARDPHDADREEARGPGPQAADGRARWRRPPTRARWPTRPPWTRSSTTRAPSTTTKSDADT